MWDLDKNPGMTNERTAKLFFSFDLFAHKHLDWIYHLNLSPYFKLYFSQTRMIHCWFVEMYLAHIHVAVLFPAVHLGGTRLFTTYMVKNDGLKAIKTINIKSV